jgi:hypothetical protein
MKFAMLTVSYWKKVGATTMLKTLSIKHHLEMLAYVKKLKIMVV